MASAADFGKFESLNFFIHERLTAVAGEIFQLLKETLGEFQEEVYRCRQENIHLKRRLAASSSSPEPDVQINHADFPLEDQNSSQGLVGTELDSEMSAVQVKVEFSTLFQDPETQEPLCHYSTPAWNPEPSPVAPTELPRDDISAHIGDSTLHERRGDGGVGVYLDSYVTVKLERCDSQLTGFDQQSYSSLVQNESSANHDDKTAIKDEPADHWVQTSGEPAHALPPSQCIVNTMPDQKISLFHRKFCPETLVHGKRFKANMKKHCREAIFHCKFCEKRYSTDSALQHHIKTQHMGEHPYYCRLCNLTFSSKSSLEEHDRIRTHSCSKCGKHFVRLNQAIIHFQTHTEETITEKEETITEKEERRDIEKGYNCKVCNRTFKQKNHMMEHAWVHVGKKK